MHKNHDRTGVVTVHRGVSKRPPNARQTTAAAARQSDRRIVSRQHSLHAQVRNLRIAISDLQIEVGNLAAASERE
jgi:hypothetical protein